MTTTGTSTTSRSYETSEAVKSNGNLFDQDEWETNEELVDSGSLLRKPKQIQPVNYANYQMVNMLMIIYYNTRRMELRYYDIQLRPFNYRPRMLRPLN